MLRFAAYARKSNDDKWVTEKSISEQLKAIDNLIQQDSLTVVWRHGESKSAKIPRVRPIYQDLVALIEAGQVNGILCWHINRLVRNMEEGGRLAQMVIDGAIKEIRTPHATYREGDNIMPLVIEAAMATQYSVDLARVVERSLDGNFRQGGTNHKTPQGYRNGRDPLNLKRGIVMKDEQRFRLIRKAWDLMLTGTYSPSQILDTLNDSWGYRTRKTRKQGGKPLCRSAIYHLFRDPFYAGFVHYKGEVLKGKHLPMVTVEEFHRVQTYLKGPSSKTSIQREYVYAGLVRCGYCGQQVTAERRTLRNGTVWENYRCSDSFHKCTQHGLSVKGIDERLLTMLESITVNPGLIDLALSEIRSHLDEQSESLAALRKQRESALELCETRLRNLEEMWISGMVRDRARYLELQEIELQNKNALVVDLATADEELELMRAKATSVADYLVFAPENYLKADFDRKRAIARALGNYSLYGKQKVLRIAIQPVILEMAHFARRFETSFEPHENRSDKPIENARPLAFSFGRTEAARLEVPDSLIEALRGPCLPRIAQEDASDDLLEESA